MKLQFQVNYLVACLAWVVQKGDPQSNKHPKTKKKGPRTQPRDYKNLGTSAKKRTQTPILIQRRSVFNTIWQEFYDPSKDSSRDETFNSQGARDAA
jgi:hypothetical protein